MAPTTKITLFVIIHSIFIVSIFAKIPDFCRFDTEAALTWNAAAGSGSGMVHKAKASSECDKVEMWSASGSSLAGAFTSQPFKVEPLTRHVIRLSVKTENLVPIPSTPSCIESVAPGPKSSRSLQEGFTKLEGSPESCNGAYLTGGPYVEYFDTEGRSDGWYPAYGTHAPPISDWHDVEQEFSPPTTAATAKLHLAFAAHAYSYDPDRMSGGRATGRVLMQNVSVHKTQVRANVLPVTMEVPDAGITTALNMAAKCLHNSQISGNFTVGSEYTISGNLSPDLAFGLFGTRRLAHPQYMQVWEQIWAANRALMGRNGQFGFFQRIMAQVLWPLGVDTLFSFTGNVTYLKENLPYVDKSVSFLMSMSNTHDQQDFLACFPKALMDNYPPGADWNDWQESRAYGSTVNFQTWYVRMLRRFSALHREFSSSFGSSHLADIYLSLANNITLSVQSKFWKVDHFVTNARWSADCSPQLEDDGVWVDDQLWAVVNGVANKTQASVIWEWLHSNPDYELVPTRWSNKTGNARYAETWYGRLGVGDILMRYHSKNNPQTNATDSKWGLELLRRIAAAFAKHGNIYESYTMQGDVGGDTGTDYLEHCAGFLWSVLDGPFGVNFDSDMEAAATITPQFDDTWLALGRPSAEFMLRGVRVNMTFSAGGLSVSGKGGLAAVLIRIVEGNTSRIVQLGGPSSQIRGGQHASWEHPVLV